MKEKRELPKWVGRSLQSLAYWVAYKSSIYSAYPFSEGALVDELLTVISRWKNWDECIERERVYKDLGKGIKKDLFLDLAIGIKTDEGTYGKRLNSNTIRSAIEVKRYSPKRTNTLSNIMLDIEKLHLLKRANEIIRCFLIVVSQGERPVEFITDKFHRKRRNIYTGEEDGIIAKIVDVGKSYNSTRGSKKGNYVILIEIQ